jgi:hypothetical protein
MKSLLILLFFIPILTYSQEYTEVVEMPGKTAGQLYNTAREWFAKSFITADNTLLMDDRIAGKIIAKGSIHITESYLPGEFASVPVLIEWYPNFTIIVSFKDGKYKNEITDISITTGVGENSSGTTKPFKEYLDKLDFYKERSDPEWFINKEKIGKAAAFRSAQPNKATYNLISKTETEMKDLLAKLQSEMKKAEDNW